MALLCGSLGVVGLLAIAIGWIVIYAVAWIEIALLGACALGLLLLLRSMLPIWTTEIGVTNHRLIVKRGWLARSTDELQLNAIEKVNFKQGFFGRLFGFGHVDVHGTGMDDLHIPAVADPVGLLRAIEEATIPGNNRRQRSIALDRRHGRVVDNYAVARPRFMLEGWAGMPYRHDEMPRSN